MDFATLKTQLSQRYTPANRTFLLGADGLGSSTISSLLAGPLNLPSLSVTGTDGPVSSDPAQTVTVSGTATIPSVGSAPVQADFFLGADGTPQLALSVFLDAGASWSFVRQFPPLANSIFKNVGLGTSVRPRFVYASADGNYPVATPAPGAAALKAGLNFYGAIAPGGKPFDSLEAVIGKFSGATTAGPIEDHAYGPTLDLRVDYNSTLQKYFPNLEIPVELALVSEFSPDGKRANIGFEFAVSFHFGDSGVRLSTLLTNRAIGVLEVRGDLENISIPSPAQVANLIGKGDLLSSLPGEFQGQGDLKITALGFGIGVKSLAVESVWIRLAALQDRTWEVVPGLFTLRNIRAAFVAQKPFDSANREITATLSTDLDILPAANAAPGTPAILQMEVDASWPDYTIKAGLREGTSFSLTALLARFLPQVQDAPAFNLQTLGLEVKLSEPRQYTFGAGIVDPWVFAFAGQTVLTVQHAEFSLGNTGPNGALAGRFGGAIDILGVTTDFEYVLPGELRVESRIPSFEVNLGDLLRKLSGQPAPSWLPTVTFPKTNILLTRQADGGEAVDAFSLLAQPDWGTLALAVRRSGGTWGFAAGVALRALKISQIPGLGRLTSLDDVFQLDALVLVFSSMPNPQSLIPANTDFTQPYSGAASVKIPVQLTSGLNPGCYVFGKVTMGTGKTQNMVRNFLGFDASLALEMSLFLGLDPARDARLGVGLAAQVAGIQFDAQFGFFIQGEDVGFFLHGDAAVSIQGSQVQFSIDAAFVENGMFIAGTMRTVSKPVKIGPVQLGNLALVVGCDWEGIPSLGVAASLDLGQHLDSSIAVFFDSATPEKSMAAGSISDFTLRDIVDSLLGAIEQPVPAALADTLGTIGLAGTRTFAVAGGDATKLVTALDALDLPTVAEVLGRAGHLTVPTAQTQVLLSRSADKSHWYLTDLASMQHYEFARAADGSVSVSLEAQFYLVPEDVTLGSLPTFKAGYRLNGRLNLFGFHASVDFDLQPNKGFALDAQMDPIVLGNPHWFAVTAAQGTGGPQLSLATYAQASQQPHLYVNGQLMLLGLTTASMYVNASKSGLDFQLSGELIPGTSFSVHGLVGGLSQFDAGGSISVGIKDVEVDLKVVPPFKLDTTAACSLAVAFDGNTLTATLEFDFVFQGQALRVAKFDLDVTTGPLANLPGLVLEKIKERLLQADITLRIDNQVQPGINQHTDETTGQHIDSTIKDWRGNPTNHTDIKPPHNDTHLDKPAQHQDQYYHMDNGKATSKGN